MSTPSQTKPAKTADAAAQVAKKLRNITLIATDAEKLSTSSSMYHDAKARMSYHAHFLADKFSIEKHVQLFQEATKGKRVLFVGGGDGIAILPFLCAKHGAASVAVIDPSSVMENCMEVAAENPEIAGRMTFYRQTVAEVARDLRGQHAEVPAEGKFDFLFVDWVSNLLTNDSGLVEDLVEARDSLLKDSGHILPDSATLYATGLNDYEFYLSSVDWWSNVYGFSMNAMKDAVLKDPVPGSVPNNAVVTSGVKVLHVHASEITRENASYDIAFALSGIYPRTTLNFITLYTQMSFASPTGSHGFRMFSNPTDSNGIIQPISFSLPEFVPLSGAEEVKLTMNVQNTPGQKVARVLLRGSYPSGDATREFEAAYSYASYE
ncbi:arginine N-methyltransferase [Perkinsela sp. CCAP 1560/4]|nr:arginine N-methyltransferase [Perkinsela sp. CCAP 1560/4]|eukprot:KNH01754.1 arginine N-methyltransferase [Perkinsela sp. CCAP 1560/4]